MKLQRLQQGSMCVNEYFKMMESMLLKVGLQFESEEEKIARFVSGLRREVQDVVELYEYSTLDKILHLAFLKVESQLKKKQEAKRNTSYNEYYSRTWKGKERKDEKEPSKDLPPRTNSSTISHESANSSQSSITVPSNVLSVWAMVTLLQIFQQRGT